MRYLITSALPYVNGVKHLGNLVGSQLPADVYARFRRSQGHDVLLVCATDEHGTPAELAAADAGIEVAEYCRINHDIQKNLSNGFDLSWDWFGRSSSPQNKALTQHFAKQLNDNGFIEERVTEGVYSVEDGRFLPDRYVLGTCPHCGYEKARGDQCESCTRLLDPVDLLEPYSAISGSKELEVRESKHLFLRQAALVDRLTDWLDSRQNWGTLPLSIARTWIAEGLHDRCITRDLSWGVTVDTPGFEGKVFYVWFDAPIEYIAATQEWADDRGTPDEWRSWWFDTDSPDHQGGPVEYSQFLAKDNVPFHTVGFPCTILGSGEPWKTVDRLKGFNWLNYYGGKFSTSEHRGVFMDDALEILPSDVWRYYLIANAPESSDASFTWQELQIALNNDLADTLGNFVNRSLSFSVKKFGETIPDGGTPGEVEGQLQRDLENVFAQYTSSLDDQQFRRAAQLLRTLWSLGNKYIDQKAPWAAIKTDPTDTALTLRTAINLLAFYARVSAPIIPNTATVLFEHLNIASEDQTWPGSVDLELLPTGAAFSVPPILFTKIDDAQITEWEERFGGAA